MSGLVQGGGPPVGAPVESPGLRSALRVPVFRVLWTAETQSILGDQLARIALSVLVFDRTGSVPATAAIYATTYLPAILGGILLGRLGAHGRRRGVMIGTDVLRALLFLTMSLPGLPLAAVATLLAVAVFLGPGFVAAEVSLLAAALTPEQFRAGMGLRMISNQTAQVAGFAVGGALVAWLDPRGALLVNGATFAVSVLLVLRVREIGDGRGAADGRADPARDRPPLRSWLTRQVAALLALSALQGLYIVPEGLAVPFGDAHGAGPTDIGILLAAIPLGGMVGAVFVVHVRRSAQALAARMMAIACGVPLVATALTDDWRVAACFWFVSGALAAYQIEVMAAMMRAVPDHARASLVGLGTAVLLGAQGLGLVAFGFVAAAGSPRGAVALAGAVGTVCALVLAFGPLAASSGGRHRRSAGPAPWPGTVDRAREHRADVVADDLTGPVLLDR